MALKITAFIAVVLNALIWVSVIVFPPDAGSRSALVLLVTLLMTLGNLTAAAVMWALVTHKPKP